MPSAKPSSSKLQLRTRLLITYWTARPWRVAFLPRRSALLVLSHSLDALTWCLLQRERDSPSASQKFYRYELGYKVALGGRQGLGREILLRSQGLRRGLFLGILQGESLYHSRRVLEILSSPGYPGRRWGYLCLRAYCMEFQGLARES